MSLTLAWDVSLYSRLSLMCRTYIRFAFGSDSGSDRPRSDFGKSRLIFLESIEMWIDTIINMREEEVDDLWLFGYGLVSFQS